MFRLFIAFYCLFPLLLSGQESPMSFQLLKSSESGILFKNELHENNNESVLDYDYFYNGAGVGIADFDNDGLSDIFFAGNQVDDKLYKNIGNMRFTDVSKDAGITSQGWSVGVSIVDINNDGLPDIYVSRSGPVSLYRKNALYINLGGMKFKESAEEYNLAIKEPSTQTAFFDYDRDGDLDAYMITHPADFKNKDDLQTFLKNVQEGKVVSDQLLRNDNGTFVNVTKEAGITEYGYSLGIAICDINNDSWPDVFVGNDFDEPDLLLLNNRKGGFINVAQGAFKHTSNYSMGCDAADVNNDGYIDIASADMSFTSHYRSKTNMPSMKPEKFDARVKLGWNYQYMSNVLQMNTGLGTFSEVAQLSGVHQSDWSWAMLMVDLNGDNQRDIFISNGYKRDTRFNDLPSILADLQQSGGIQDINQFLNKIPETLISNVVFENKGLFDFENVSEEWGIYQEMHSHGVAYGDLDNDGDWDLVINNVDKEAVIYQNQLNPEKYLKVNIPKANAAWLNTRFYTLYENDTLITEFQPVRGYASSMDATLLFYPDENGNLPQALIYRDPANNYRRVDNPSGSIIAGENTSPANFSFRFASPTYFVPAADNAGLKIGYSENPHNDYEFQRLLPHMVSVPGPYMCKADVLNNGDDEIYVSGALDQSASFLIKDIYGNFNAYSLPAFIDDKQYEDEGCVFIDVNGDGFKDLFVSSGGGIYEPGNAENADRLYLSNGKGNFTKADLANKSYVNGGATIKGDFNFDGIEDVLVAGRIYPNHYPLPAAFTLWLGDGNSLVEEDANSIFPGINELGMVQDIVYSDINHDGFPDLICTGHWMGASVYFGSKSSKFKSAEGISGDVKGWFNCIELYDFDGNGELDVLLGNEGMNNKFHASASRPLEVYLNDFDNSGTEDVVLVKNDGDKKVPVRGKECSTEQLPSLDSKFKSYDAFAKSSVEEIYGSEALKLSYYAEVDEFRHGILYQDKNGKFSFKALPHAAQISPINDWELADLNKDGKIDIIGVGNRYQTEVETVRGDAGTGLVLIQGNEQEFTYLMPTESGLYIPFNSRHMLSIIHGEKQAYMIGNNNGPLLVIDRK
jgi:hypothetical protein